jgi:NAD-dependent SIR2 family protein deacetylase
VTATDAPNPTPAQAADALAAALAASGIGGVLVVTGAGVSAASGIPTFRGSDPGALWKQDVMELATRSFFESDPVTSWRWYLERFDGAVAAKPNPAHQALVDLERWQVQRGRPFLLVTQNIDTLHEQAGSEHLVKVHGSAAKVRCSRAGCRHGAPRGYLTRSEADLASFRAAPSLATLPRCPLCRAVLRPHVLWFDELYQEHEEYGIGRVLGAAAEADTVVFAGTSFSVGVTALVLRAAEQRGAAVFSIDPSPPVLVPPGLRLLRAAAEELLPATVARLGKLAE